MERQSVDKEDSDQDPTLPPDTVTDLMGSENQKITQKKNNRWTWAGLNFKTQNQKKDP